MLRKYQIMEILEYASKNGVVTFDAQGTIIKAVSGYQVSFTQNLTQRADEVRTLIDDVVENALQLSDSTQHKVFCGLWLDNGTLYVDNSVYIPTLTTAKRVGRLFKQISIFDWENQDCINL